MLSIGERPRPPQTGEGGGWGRGCTSGLGHLVSIEHQVTIAAHTPGPFLWSLLPNGGVVVQSKAQVVVDEVLTRGLYLQKSSQYNGQGQVSGHS